MKTLDPLNPPAVHEWTGPTGVNFRDVRSAFGTYYHDTTPPEVVRHLDTAMNTGQRVRFWLGDSATGKNWMDEYHVAGRVGRSTGWKKMALIITSSRSHGGCAILTDCIVRLDVGGRTVYQHPGFVLPVIRIYFEGKYAGSEWAADVNGDVGFARFKSELAATRWAAFMRGERAAK